MFFSRVILAILILFLTSNTSLAQIDPVGSYNRHIASNWKGEFIRIGPFRVKGSPYLLGEAFQGNIAYNNGKSYTNTNILYDIYDQRAGVEINNFMVEGEGLVDSFSINLPEKYGGNKLLFKSGSLFENPSIKYYFNVVSDGEKISFLKVYRNKLIPDPFNNLDKELRVFQQYFEYYLFNKKTKTLSNIKLRKKDIAKALADDQFMKNYLSIKEVDFTKELEIIELIDNYNNNKQP